MFMTLAGCLLALTPVAEPAKPADERAKLAGVWLAADAEAEMDRPLARLWFSKFTVEGDRFRVSKPMFHPKDLTGTFTLDPTTQPKSIDLKLNELDYTELGFPMKIPAGTRRGIYKRDGDRLTLCFALDPALKRPTEFAVTGKKTAVLTLGRADPNYREPPKELTVTVLGPDGVPVPATVYYSMDWGQMLAAHEGRPLRWKFSHGFPTGPDGTVKVPYHEIGKVVSAWAADRKLIGRATVSPFALQQPAVTVKLGPEIRLKGTIANKELKMAGVPLGWTWATLYSQGIPVGSYNSPDGKFEFPVAPGEYEILAYGEDLHNKRVSVKVPAGRPVVEVPPIHLTASALALLKGQPAPELKDVVGWKGNKTLLAGLKGKYVLLEFWGYWCSPCIAAMPVLFELHDRYNDKGLAIVGVHLDAEGEIDTPAKLDERMADIRKREWNGRDLPFPVALCSGQEVEDGVGEKRQGGPPKQYGVTSYPTTILIDREGKVVGRFPTRDREEALETMAKLLKK